MLGKRVAKIQVEGVRIPTFLYNMTYNGQEYFTWNLSRRHKGTAVFGYLVSDRLDTTLRRLVESGRFVMPNYNIITEFTTLA